MGRATMGRAALSAEERGVTRRNLQAPLQKPQGQGAGGGRGPCRCWQHISCRCLSLKELKTADERPFRSCGIHGPAAPAPCFLGRSSCITWCLRPGRTSTMICTSGRRPRGGRAAGRRG